MNKRIARKVLKISKKSNCEYLLRNWTPLAQKAAYYLHIKPMWLYTFKPKPFKIHVTWTKEL